MNNNFSSRNFVKGRIAETIFEEMFCEAGNYTIIPFGYEKIVPELARLRGTPKSAIAERVIDTIRNSPDYAVIFPDRRKIFLVEVKFQAYLDLKTVINKAREQMKRWHPSWIFIASLSGFYMGECSRILAYKGIIKLKTSIVKKEVQEKYLKLLKEFEK